VIGLSSISIARGASLAAILTFSLSAIAGNSGITYHGRIVKPDGNYLEDAAVQFKLQIRTPGAQDCLMFEEVQTQNMLGSGYI
jgi:hypothetical protein